MEESKKIKLNIGHVSLDKKLGPYYIDMRPALIHYTQNIYGGRFDDKQVPMIDTPSGLHYFPINIAQYAFMIHAEYCETQDEEKRTILSNCIDRLESMKTEDDDTAVWYHYQKNEKYDLPIPWASAMAQGEVISFYLRMYQLTKNELLLDTSIKAYHYLKKEVKDGGVRRYDEDGNLWFEEYPTKKPLLVLNGFIYTIFGLFDLYRVTQDEDVKKDIDASLDTLKNTLPKFDAGFWSFYDLRDKELVRYYYQKNVHVPQLEVLYRLTNDMFFKTYKDKWDKQLQNYPFVQLMYRLKYRMPWLYHFIIRMIWKK